MRRRPHSGRETRCRRVPLCASYRRAVYPMKLAFLTSTPQNIREGSGTFNGIATLARALTNLGVQVDFFTPTRKLPIYTAGRIWFNWSLRRIDFSGYDAIVGFDLDGYCLPRGGAPHIAAIKGVIRDEARFERGATRWTMMLQAACERHHAGRADLVLVTSRYTADRVREFYSPKNDPAPVPELIDLAQWRALLETVRVVPDPFSFTVLCVCRFYRRKRVELLVEAAAKLQAHIPNLAVRIVGRGPEEQRLHRIAKRLRLCGLVTWLGDVSNEQLAAEYRRANIFSLPSVQEGFGIVFLEAMAAGLPIVAAGASSVSEVVPQGLLVDPESAEALAHGIEQLYRDAPLRERLVGAGLERVVEFDAPKIARQFLREIAACAQAPGGF